MQIAPSRPQLAVVNGQATSTSTQIAENFGKRHADVMRTIRTLECSREFNERNFALVEYADEKGEKRPAYTITRDGFVFLAMGFTGKEAAQWKEAYIEAFNAMEHTLQHAAPSLDAEKLIEALRCAVVFSNKQVADALRYACMGLTMQEVGKLLGCGPRQIRDVFYKIRTLGLSECEPYRTDLEQALIDKGVAFCKQTLRARIDVMWQEDSEASKTPRQLALKAEQVKKQAAREAKKASTPHQTSLEGGAQ